MANCRPITSLNTLSTLLERLALSRLWPFMLTSGNFSEYQSTYRAGHSTETVLLQVHNDLVCNRENQLTTVLLALDISAAFDTINIHCLIIYGWIYVLALLRWTGCVRFLLAGLSTLALVHYGHHPWRGYPVSLKGVFLVRYCSRCKLLQSTTSLQHIAHRVHLDQYADNTQLYVTLRPSDISPFDAVSVCVSNIWRWFLENGMLLNPKKAEAVLFGTRA